MAFIRNRACRLAYGRHTLKAAAFGWHLRALPFPTSLHHPPGLADPGTEDLGGGLHSGKGAGKQVAAEAASAEEIIMELDREADWLCHTRAVRLALVA
jgi:hypothetical protein